ncbi:stage V sporulation protein AD [Natranaerovirga pectinivora]|uniref:Stage V sporulation protein AD n=1 Tax=Natranaerovirga pectinivora TaxID=682400 RepID=A0A4R3MJJ2_9FIRM|nr:stage V sporulation protein AD [Natranaerovirga pectinivora]TCT14290.1 stage V sporulation protein AD [Natranaerovirga pectinivora]
MTKIIGKQSVQFENPPIILGFSSVVGPKEGQGPIGEYFDKIVEDPAWGEPNWELAESKFQKEAAKLAVQNASLAMTDIRYIFGGDLLNQLIASSFGLKDYQVPFFGLYGACSTMAESLQLASMSIDGGFAEYSLAITSSHYCSAEKQFRFPLELGTQRPPTASWTVTGSGAIVLGKQGKGPKITHITTGKIMDYGVTDAMNMGASMAPAAVDTLYNHFKDLGRTPADYDLIATGDLGIVGKALVKTMLYEKGYKLEDNYTDCGLEIFAAVTQDTHAGGSGCACSAVTLTGYFLKKMQSGELNRILIVPTGALLSPVSSNEGESVPGIAHAVVIEN